MNIVEAKKKLLGILFFAVQHGVQELYLFAVEDRLFAIYGKGASEPQLAVFEEAGAVYRALLETMENHRVSTGEIAKDQEWCLDFPVAGARAHFDLVTTHMAVIKITSQPAVEAPRFAPPPSPPDEEEIVIDESALAAAAEELPPPPSAEDVVPIIIEPVQPAPPSAPELKKPSEEQAMDMVGAILLNTKPFPSEVIQLVPLYLANRGQFVPLFLDEQKRLWVAMTDLTRQSAVRQLLGLEVEVFKVDYQTLEGLLMCYRVDPRHSKH